MQNIRQIVFSSIEPEFKEVGWLSVDNNNLVLKFYSDGEWKVSVGKEGGETWSNNNLRLEPTNGHLYLDYTTGLGANFFLDNNGHLMLRS